MLKRGTRVYLSAVPNRPAEESFAAAIRVRAAGFEPVPHVAVRNFANVGELDDFSGAAQRRSRCRQPCLSLPATGPSTGPSGAALDAIDSGVLRRRGIRTIGIAGYPEGHPRIGDEELNRAMAEKSRRRRRSGLTVEIVTQFCFDARAILNFIARLRAFGFEHRLRIGLAGPTSLTSLMRYASRCGVRASAQGLARRAGLMRQMFAMTTPDDLVRTLAEAAPANVVPHFFSFGGIPATSRWARAVADGLIKLERRRRLPRRAAKSWRVELGTLN